MTAGLAMAPWVADQARLLLAQNGHAWLLHGPSGLGQYDLALSLASAWLCDQPSGEGACVHCGSCHAIDVRTHADLAVLMPETVLIERGWPLGEKAQAEIDDKKRKASREIRVEAMRETIEFSQRTSARGRAKVVLVYPAERMNHVTANALLKTLEEPPGDVKFVLATEASHLLLPTIRSRCMGHAMAWPEMSAALDWLAAQGFPPADARALLRIAGGRPDDALLLGRSGPPAESCRQTRGCPTNARHRHPAQPPGRTQPAPGSHRGHLRPRPHPAPAGCAPGWSCPRWCGTPRRC